VDEKIHFSPTLCSALWGGGGGEGDNSSTPLKICLLKNVNYTEIIIKSILKTKFLMKTSETKMFAKIF
jgi:hypothetical protein